MSRIVGLMSWAEVESAQRAARVPRMQAMMPRGRDAQVNVGLANFGWSGAAGGAVAQHGTWAAAIDGEVLNAAELRVLVPDAGAGDAALVLALTRKLGMAETLSRLLGDFALAVVDGDRGRLWLARDRVGVKPLYYARAGRTIAFASQPAALLALPEVSAEPNRQYLGLVAGSHYRTFDNAPDQSPFAAIAQLTGGHFVAFDSADALPSTQAWWTLGPKPLPSTNENELAEIYRDTLLQAVGRRVAVSGRSAFTLSGGMDSSSVLCCAAEVTGRKQSAVSSVYADPTFDERAEIQDVVEARVENWQAVHLPNELDVPSLVRELVAVHNEPVATATWLSHSFVCQEVSAAGFQSLFGGLGGDELNAGEYEYFPLYFADLRMQGDEARLNREVEFWARYHDHPIHRKDARVAEAMIASLTDGARNGVCRPNLERQGRYAAAVRRDFFDVADFVPVMPHPFTTHLANRAFQDLTRETTPCCLRAEDRQCTAAGLRHFDPFLDHQVVELMFNVPGDMKIRDGVTKWLLREAMKDILPEATRARIKKTGWNAPAHVWFSGERLVSLRDMVSSAKFRSRGVYDADEVLKLIDDHQTTIETGANRENHMMFLWQLVNVAGWLDWVDQLATTRHV